MYIYSIYIYVYILCIYIYILYITHIFPGDNVVITNVNPLSWDLLPSNPMVPGQSPQVCEALLPIFRMYNFNGPRLKIWNI